ncbi:hypothetical protein Clow_02224 [Corynebacterium lowii]|uniref:Uncharacterized protein n=1 Tax=Corynebacterium lowii TaxID=1544413 RepID=A0A0Q0U8N0_9CORY|nr:hypothetical protein Clow_02224 [Corynebacterium lowii]MDP9852727.1 hypothetical protein [Corynebacterium lowii]
MLSVSLGLFDVAGDMASYYIATINSLLGGFAPVPPLS